MGREGRGRVGGGEREKEGREAEERRWEVGCEKAEGGSWGWGERGRGGRGGKGRWEVVRWDTLRVGPLFFCDDGNLTSMTT